MALMAPGIGLRRREGYGALCLWPRDWIADTRPITKTEAWATSLPLLRGKAAALREGRTDLRPAVEAAVRLMA